MLEYVRKGIKEIVIVRGNSYFLCAYRALTTALVGHLRRAAATSEFRLFRESHSSSFFSKCEHIHGDMNRIYSFLISY